MKLEKVKEIAEQLKENLPTLLSSKKGLFVACSIWNVLDAKDRKIVVKSFKEIIKETFVNKVAHLFVCHMLLTLDDTILAKKKIITPLLMAIDDNINDPNYQRVISAIFSGPIQRLFYAEDLEAFNAFNEYQTSKKDPEQRKGEIMPITLKAFFSYLEEHISFYIS